MALWTRELTPRLRAAAKAWPAVVLTGPRRAGKTYLLRWAFPRASYHLLEDPDVLARVRADPRGWLEGIRTPAILDEIQNAPELLPYVRTRIDTPPRRKGRWLITGSQDFALMEGVTESMTGRAAIFQLLPLSFRELGKWDLLRGGFPEVWIRPGQARDWFRSYVQTYFERDVRAIAAVRDLGAFRRFLSLLAARNSQVLNRTDIAGPLGVSVPTVTHWLSILETTGQILLVPPWFENLGKRVIKSPKLYFIDTGVLLHLLGIEDLAAIERSPFIGGVFEALLASEIAKNQVNSGRSRELYWFRDQQGLEVDFLVPDHQGGVTLIEAKWSKTIMPEMARAIQALLPRFSRPARGLIVHPRSSQAGTGATALAPGVSAISIDDYLSL